MGVGFVGVGTMGSRMVANLIKGGHGIWAYDIAPSAMGRAVELGATPCGSLREAAEGRDAVILSLTTPEVVERAVLGQEGVLAAAQVSPLLIDTSTSLPSVTKRIAAAALEKGCRMLDAPVSGGPEGAESGTLSIMVGGPAEAFEEALPLLKLLGKDIFRVGDWGAGNTMKLLNNTLTGITRAAIAETLMMGTMAGMDPKTVLQVISASSGNSRSFQGMVPRILRGQFEPGFSIDLMHKDLDLAARLGHELGVPMALLALAKQLYQSARAAGLGGKDCAALALPLERLMGTEIREDATQQ